MEPNGGPKSPERAQLNTTALELWEIGDGKVCDKDIKSDDFPGDAGVQW